MNESDILNLIKQDATHMEILRVARSLQLPDWLIGAGFIRNPVWDFLHGYKKQTALTDIDVAYFDPTDLREATEEKYQDQLRKMLHVEWSVTNQARMDKINHQKSPYISTADAIAHWPETATAVGVTLNDDDELILIAPLGIKDLISLNLRMTPDFGDGYGAFGARIQKKQWLMKWPKLVVVPN
jgi:hypothetical protein